MSEQTAENAAPCRVGCGHPPADHDENGECMHLCDCAWPSVENGLRLRTWLRSWWVTLRRGSRLTRSGRALRAAMRADLSEYVEVGRPDSPRCTRCAHRAHPGEPCQNMAYLDPCGCFIPPTPPASPEPPRVGGSGA